MPNNTDYNIISNCCLGGHLYRTQGIPYQNPFVWSAVLAESMKTLISSFDRIEWANVVVEKCDWVKYAGTPRYMLVVDNKIKIYYTHYIKDDRYDTPVVNDVDVFYKDIEQYIIDKYTNRLQRMSSNPVFIILDEIPHYDYTKDNIYELLHIHSSAKLIVITKHEEFLRENDERIHCIYDDTERFDKSHCPIYYTKYRDEINEFIWKK